MDEELLAASGLVVILFLKIVRGAERLTVRDIGLASEVLGLYVVSMDRDAILLSLTTNDTPIAESSACSPGRSICGSNWREGGKVSRGKLGEAAFRVVLSS